MLEKKSAQAIMGINAAAKCLGLSLTELKKNAQAGWSSLKIAKFFETCLSDLGATPAFSTSVAIADQLKESTIATPRENIIWGEDQALLIDCGAKLNGYFTDATRMFFNTDNKTKLFSSYQSLKDAQRNSANKIKNNICTFKWGS